MSKQNLKSDKQPGHRSPCPVAGMLDIVGDKWTLLVVRDLFMGKSTYSEFQKSPENIPSNILAERLKRLQQNEVINKSRYQERPVRYAYALTEKGKALWPVMKESMQWGNKYIPDTYDAKAICERIEANNK